MSCWVAYDIIGARFATETTSNAVQIPLFVTTVIAVRRMSAASWPGFDTGLRLLAVSPALDTSCCQHSIQTVSD